MKKILYLMPAPVSRGPMGPGELVRRQQLLLHRASAEFEWAVGDTDEGPFTIESMEDEERCIPGMLRAAVAAERQGFAGIILGCYADPGLARVRTMLKIPVVGPAESSLQLARTLGKSCGILTVSDAVIPLIEKVVKTNGVEDCIASIRTTGTTVLHVADDREAMLRKLAKAGEIALTEDGADVLVLGCMSLAFLNVAPELARRLNAPVVCPLSSAINSAEAMVRAQAVLSSLVRSEAISAAG